MQKLKARAIFTNDAECDDMNSLVHLLLYANDIDIEGIVLSSSVFHYAGDPEAGIEPYRWAGGDWMWEYLDAYEQVWSNLVAHDPAYPTAEALRAVTCIGNIKTTGCMDEDTDGSRLIREAILRDDPRPVYLLAGGGTNTIARALKSLDDDFRGTPEWEAIYDRVCQQAIIYMIITQDDTYRDYIAGAWPGVRMLHNTELAGIGFFFDETCATPEQQRQVQGSWLKEHLLSQGPLLAHYHTWLDGHVYPGELPKNQFGSNPELAKGNWWGKATHVQFDMISEGDSPSFLYLVDRGLRSLEDPGYGGWGGRFARKADNEFHPEADYWKSAPDAAEPPMKPNAYQFTRWYADWMYEFAERARWCVTPRYEDANHAPWVEVAEGLDLTAAPGETVTLHAWGGDPDDDPISFDWFRYADADSCEADVALDVDGATCIVTVPADARPCDTIHLVCRVVDAHPGSDLPLVAYARVIITVM